jgi:hypothetical protein
VPASPPGRRTSRPRSVSVGHPSSSVICRSRCTSNDIGPFLWRSHPLPSATTSPGSLRNGDVHVWRSQTSIMAALSFHRCRHRVAVAGLRPELTSARTAAIRAVLLYSWRSRRDIVDCVPPCRAASTAARRSWGQGVKECRRTRRATASSTEDRSTVTIGRRGSSRRDGSVGHTGVGRAFRSTTTASSAPCTTCVWLRAGDVASGSILLDPRPPTAKVWSNRVKRHVDQPTQSGREGPLTLACGQVLFVTRCSRGAHLVGWHR